MTYHSSFVCLDQQHPIELMHVWLTIATGCGRLAAVDGPMMGRLLSLLSTHRQCPVALATAAWPSWYNDVPNVQETEQNWNCKLVHHTLAHNSNQLLHFFWDQATVRLNKNPKFVHHLITSVLSGTVLQTMHWIILKYPQWLLSGTEWM